MSVATQIERIKAKIEDAYTAISVKGGIVPTVKNVANLADAIASIVKGKGNALTTDVLNGKTFSNDDGEQVGTMPNNGTTGRALNYSDSYTIPAGYTSGGIVTSPADRYDDGYDAGKDDYNPTTASLNNSGTLTVTNSAGTTRLTKSFSNSYDAGNTAGQASGKTSYEPTSATLTNGGVLSVKNSAGTERYSTTFDNSYNAGVSATKKGDATAGNVLDGKYFTSNSAGVNIKGTMVNQGTKTYTINPSGKQTIPAGYHDGNGYVQANPNQNSGTYTYASGSTGAKTDMGVNNTYRYVDATNVYAKGRADVTITLKITKSGTQFDATSQRTFVSYAIPSNAKNVSITFSDRNPYGGSYQATDYFGYSYSGVSATWLWSVNTSSTSTYTSGSYALPTSAIGKTVNFIVRRSSDQGYCNPSVTITMTVPADGYPVIVT